MGEEKRLEDYPEHTRAFLKFIARETRYSVDEVVRWQHASSASPIQLGEVKKSKTYSART